MRAATMDPTMILLAGVLYAIAALGCALLKGRLRIVAILGATIGGMFLIWLWQRRLT